MQSKFFALNVRFKRIIFDYYLLIAFVLFVVLLAVAIYCMVSLSHCNIVLTFSIASGIVSFVFFVQKQKLDELHLFYKLFQDFNKRYDELNDDMNKIAFAQGDDPDDKILNRYVNLCGEEYLYYKKGYIDPDVWKTWKNGMRDFLKSDRIKKKWQEEGEGSSYYGLTYQEVIS